MIIVMKCLFWLFEPVVKDRQVMRVFIIIVLAACLFGLGYCMGRFVR